MPCAGIETAVDAMLQQLGLQQPGDSIHQKLLLIRQTLSEQILPAWKEAQLCKSRGVAPTLADASNFPLGFSTGSESRTDPGSLLKGFCSSLVTGFQLFLIGNAHDWSIYSAADQKVDLGAKILRMLFIRDLRGLQTEIDDLIAQMQVGWYGCSCAAVNFDICLTKHIMHYIHSMIHYISISCAEFFGVCAFR